jgi:hypothetical protein
MVNFYMNRGTGEDNDGDELDEVKGGVCTDARRRTITELIDLVGEMAGILLVAAHPERGEGVSTFNLAHDTLTPMVKQLSSVLVASSPHEIGTSAAASDTSV